MVAARSEKALPDRRSASVAKITSHTANSEKHRDTAPVPTTIAATSGMSRSAASPARAEAGVAGSAAPPARAPPQGGGAPTPPASRDAAPLGGSNQPAPPGGTQPP